MSRRMGPSGAGHALQAIGSLLRAALAPLMRLHRAMRHRRQATILAALEERALADIGLTRADLRFAFSEPVWRDPTEILARRAGERRLNRRPAAYRLDPARAEPGRLSPTGTSLRSLV